MILDQEKISRIKNLLKFKPKGMSISDISHSLKMNRNSVAKYLDLLLVSGQVEMQSYGTAKVYFLSQRVPLSAMLSLASDLVIILDSDFRIIQVNENFLSAFEMTRDALIGKLLTDVPLSFVPRLPLDEVVRESADKKEIKIDVTYTPGPDTGRSTENVYYRVRLVPTVFEEGSRGITILLENVTNTKIYEHQLEASEARYRNIIEDQTEFISRFLPDGTHRFVNEAYLRYFGLKREDVENKIFIPAIPPEDKALVKAHFASFTPEIPVQSIDHRIMMPDGNVRWQRWSDRAIFDEHGKITEYQSVGRDITDQKNAEVKAAEYIHGLEVLSRKGVNFVETGNPGDIFRSIGEGALELVPDAVVVVHSYDETTRLFSTRMVLDETSRYQIKSLIGMDPLMMTYPISDRPRENLLSTKLVRIDTPLYEAINHSVSREKCEDVEKILNITSIYIIGLARKEILLGRVALLMKKNATPSRPDIFEAYIREASIALQRCYAEEAFRDNEEQFRNIVDYSPFPISIVDKTGVITYLNPRFTEVFGYEKHELPTIHDWQEKAYPDKKVREEMEATRLLWLETAEIGKIKQVQAIVKTKAGVSKNIEIRAVSMSKSQQFITYEDITQRLDVEKIRALHTSIVESSDDAIVGKDLGGIVISWNKGAEKVYGYTAGEMVGQSIYRIIPQQYHDEFRDMLTKIERGEIVEDHEGIRIRKDGTIIDISLTLSPIHSDDGKIIGASAIARDITRQKQDEKELLIKKFAMDSSINGIAIADLDKKITYANQTFLRMFGYTSFAEIAGMPVNTFTHGDEREQQTYEEIYKSLEKKGGWVGETQPKKKDGTHFDAQLSASIVKNAAGEPLCCMATLVDVTIRKRAEYESFLKENAIAATMNAIVILDLAGNVIYANRAFIEIMGYSSLEDVIYHPIEYFCHGNESILAEMHKFQEESKHKNKWKSEVRIIDRNGKITPTELTMFQVANSANRMVYIILSFVDITEKKALEQKINNTDRELSAVIEFLPDAVSIVDSSGRVTAWNRAMEEFSGIKKENIVGHPANRNALPVLNNQGPPLVDLLDLPPDTLTQKYPGISRIGQSLVREVEDPRGDASKSRKYLEKATYIHDSEGNVTGTIMNIRDVTALKIFEQSLHKAHGLSGSLAQSRIDEMNVEIEQLKQELHRQKERNADYSGIVTAMNASTDMILVLDNTNKITHYNAAMAAQFGHSFEEEVLGKHISSILAPEYRKIVLDYIADAEHEPSNPIRYSLITHEGRITVEASVSIIRDHSGDPEGFIIIQRPREKSKSKG